MTTHDALLHVQTCLKVPKARTNSFGGYQYRSAEDIMEAAKPHLKDVGMSVFITYDMVILGDRIYVKATATFGTGETAITATGFAREAETKKGMDLSQITGAASSYSAKFALSGLFLIDDGEDADETNDHGISLAHMGRMETLKESYPPKAIRMAMKDYNAERLGDIPEEEFGSFEQLVDGLHKSEQNGDL